MNNRELGFQLSDQEVIALAGTHMLQMHQAAQALMHTSVDPDYDRGVIETVALLCYPETMMRGDRDQAVTWVTQIIDVLNGRE